MSMQAVTQVLIFFQPIDSILFLEIGNARKCARSVHAVNHQSLRLDAFRLPARVRDCVALCEEQGGETKTNKHQHACRCGHFI